MIWVKGWKGELDADAVARVIDERQPGLPLERKVALRLLSPDYTLQQMAEEFPGKKRSYLSWLRWKAGTIVKTVVAEDPARFGLERINVRVDQKMGTAQLADHCGVSKSVIKGLVRRHEELGLPAPKMRLGRTLKGRAWVFPPETARAYIHALIS